MEIFNLMESYKTLSQSLAGLRSSDKDGLTKLFQTFEQIGKISQGQRHKMAPSQIVALVAQGMESLKNVFDHSLSTREKCFLIQHLGEYLLLPTFEQLCSGVIQADHLPVELAIVIEGVENYPDIWHNKDHFLFSEIARVIETRYKRYQDLFPILKASKDQKFQDDIWFKIEPEKLKCRDIAKLLDNDWINIPSRIFKDLTGLMDIPSAPSSLILRALVLGATVYYRDISIFGTMQKMGQKILSKENDPMVLIMAHLHCDIGDEDMEKAYLEKILEAHPSLQVLQFFKEYGGFIEIEQIENYIDFTYNIQLFSIGHKPLYLKEFDALTETDKDWIDQIRELPSWKLYLFFKESEEDSLGKEPE